MKRRITVVPGCGPWRRARLGSGAAHPSLPSVVYEAERDSCKNMRGEYVICPAVNDCRGRSAMEGDTSVLRTARERRYRTVSSGDLRQRL